MIEVIKLVGSIVGLVTGLFVFIDRVLKGRPVASLTISEDAGRKLVCIRVTNISPYDVAIIDMEVKPPVYFLTESLGVRKLIEGVVGYRPSFMLKPGKEKELILAPNFQGNVAIEALAAQRVTVWISWRRGNTTWLPQVPLWVATDTTTIRQFGLEKA
jgi:hypothetical protein